MDDIIKLMEQLAENPLSYELHLKLVADMKAAGLDDELRSARESMHDVFPLTEDLWMQWLEDEKAKSDTEEQRRYILALYTMAVDDYLSIPIWKDYVEFVSDAALPDVDEDEMDTDSSKEGWLSMDDARTIFGNAKRTTEYHLTRSHIIWNVIKDFELRALERDPSEEKVEKVRQMLLERLAVPHMKLSDTFTDYSSFETKYDLENYDNRVLAANAIKAKTEKEFFKRDTFEMKLLGDSPQLSDYLDYIISETKGKSVNKKIVRTLYERAVTVFCLHTTVWDHYVSFLISSYRVKDIVIGVCDRAIRNCSWSGAIWAHRLRIGAGFNEDVEDLKTALQRGLDFLAQASIEEWVAAILGYCDGLAVTLVKGITFMKMVTQFIQEESRRRLKRWFVQFIMREWTL
ncbi:hypothetical protein BC829DRAFT_256720 [Chytridium lagenaria]|nr:hypothetical protein BC829DRAFT_256720 [Chytridium lagenaria]